MSGKLFVGCHPAKMVKLRRIVVGVLGSHVNCRHSVENKERTSQKSLGR